MKNDLFLLLQKMEVHEKIRAIRQAKGFTQEYVADRLGIEAVNYGRIERGQAKLTIDRFVEISQILESSPLDFFASDKTSEPAEQILSYLKKIYEKEQQILEKLNQIKNEDCL